MFGPLSPTQPRRVPGRNPCRHRTAAALALLLASGVGAQDPVDLLADLSIEELMGVRVSLAARAEQPLAATAAAVHILTRDDIRRSGATSIAEVLRLVPGMQVAQIDANKWAITARGFNERFANKLLVQVDGRTVYTASFTGVYWEELGLLLEDVERVEVIRGPGATLWGANAVNGIVNVVTQPASQTQGTLVSVAAGNEVEADVALRHGVELAPEQHLRLYARSTRRAATIDTAGRDAADGGTLVRGGGRYDGSHHWGDLSVQVEGAWGDMGNRVRLPALSPPFFRPEQDPIDILAGHALARWEVTDRAGSRWTTQVFYNLQDREEFVEQRLQTLDMDLQNHRQFGRHDLVWGGGLRLSWDRFSQPLALRVDNRARSERRVGLFVQDDIAWAADRLHLILGTKFEHNGFTGFEVQPTARLRWSPSARLTAWGGIARAVRTPSRGERAVRVILPGSDLPPEALPEGVPAGFAALTGGADLSSEHLHAAEAGLRLLATPRLLLDGAVFLHRYDDLRSLQPLTPYIDRKQPTPILILPVSFRNAMEGHSHGFEIAANVDAGHGTRVDLHYAYVAVDLTDPAGISAELDEGGSPTHQTCVRVGHDLGERIQLDAVLRHVDDLPALGVDAYTELDLRGAVRLGDGLEAFAAVRNALSADHQEYLAQSLHSDPGRVERSLRVGLTWRP